MTTSHYSFADFVNETTEKKSSGEFFEIESDRIMRINLGGQNQLAWMKKGAMIAYTGNIKFALEDLFEHGVKTVMKRFVTSESGKLVKATGQGQLYIADGGNKVKLVKMQNDTIVVNGSNLLAFEPSVKWDIRFQKLAAMMANGLTNIRLEGSGMIAVATAYDPLALRVKPGAPVMTDPSATVAWSGNLEPKFKTDISLKTIIGRGSGESIQMQFEGDGFVIVQPDCIYTPHVVTG